MGSQSMDIKKPNKIQGRFNKSHKLLVILVSVILVLGIMAIRSSDSIIIKRSQIIVGTVKSGDLNVVVEGYGKLVSGTKQLITALTQATVKEVVLKPGASVSADSIILRMENPVLSQQVENASQELEQQKANLRQLKLNNLRELLNEEADLAEMKARYESATLKRSAEEKLVKNGIVAQLTYKESLLNEQQLGKRIDIFTRREKQLAKVHQEAINIQLERLKQHQGKLDIAQERVDKLVVRAGLDGVLQTLSVELGQSLSPGQEIALIGSVTELIAMIKVPQNQAQQIIIGQKVIIDTRRDKIEGRVSRIDPIVENNTVNVEIALPDHLPVSARPQLNIDGSIITDTLTNAIYLERPANVKANTEVVLYRVDASFENANLNKVKFGRTAGRYIEIISGAQNLEKYILSELPGLKQSVNKLKIE